MRYVITGGAGFIGSHIADALIAGGHEVVVVDDFSAGRHENLDPDNVTLLEGSIEDTGLLGEACEGADGVFHEAAVTSVQASVRDPAHSNRVNVDGTLNVLIAARDAGVRKVVMASSAAVYGNDPALPKKESMRPDPLSPYAASKLADEHYCKVFSELYDLQTVCLRYFNVYGPRQDPKSEYAAVIPKFIERLSSGLQPVIFGDGLQTRDFVYVGDVARANLMAMESDATGVYNIACGQRTSLLELAGALTEIAGLPSEPGFAPPQPGDVRHSVADISGAEEAFSYEPSYSLEKGLSETYQWFAGGV